jgi:very-short-patch-repair endonuclease
MKKNSYLRFDFCLSDSKILIEYDGLQHFSDIGLFWNNNSFKDIVKRDVFKNKWAEDNGYRLLRIGYLDRKNIPEILSRELLCHT